MEQLKVRKKDVIIGNVVIYLMLSLLFLYLQYAYRHQLSPFSILYLRKSIELFWPIGVAALFASFFVWKHHHLATSSFSLTVLLVTYKVVEGLFIEFNKVIVIALFFFIVIAYFLYQLLADYLGKAAVNPNYSSIDLFDPLLKKIDCSLELDGEILRGSLTNWDEEGCFVKMENPHLLTNKIKVVVHFQGRDFVQVGEVVAQSVDLFGIGIKFHKTPKDLKIFNWTEFMELIQELGFEPRRLR
jgi:hypothetical protein